MGKIVRIPVLPHIKKFVLARMKTSEPVKADLRNPLGLHIYAIIQSVGKVYPGKDPHTEILEVELNFEIQKRRHRIGKLVQVNVYFDKSFKDHLFEYIEAQVELGIPARQACMNFLAKYKIKEEEYSYENAYRMWLRYKNDEYEREHKKKVAIPS